jgi:hypothetical protein
MTRQSVATLRGGAESRCLYDWFRSTEGRNVAGRYIRHRNVGCFGCFQARRLEQVFFDACVIDSDEPLWLGGNPAGGQPRMKSPGLAGIRLRSRGCTQKPSSRQRQLNLTSGPERTLECRSTGPLTGGTNADSRLINIPDGLRYTAAN